MEHRFIADGLPLATWREAFPGALLLTRQELPRLGSLTSSGRAEGMAWLRVRDNDEIAALLAEFRRYTSLTAIVLCDAPEDAGAAIAIAHGAAGYCNSHAAPEVLRQIALVVSNGGLWIGRSLVQKLIGGTARMIASAAGPRPGPRLKELSEREREVALRVAQGASNREVAAELAITERTVKAHLGSIFEKLQVRDRLQLSLYIHQGESGNEGA